MMSVCANPVISFDSALVLARRETGRLGEQARERAVYEAM